MAGLLADYGVTAVFGVPGGQTLPLYYGILDEGNRIRHILMKDDIDATFAADAYARISGGIGVCDATAGCGAIKFISGLAEAYNTSIPVIAIGSEMEGDWLAARYRGTGSQVVDSKEVLKPVTPTISMKNPPRWRSVAVPDPYLSSVHGGPSGRNIPGRTMRATENWPACPPTVLPRPATKSTRRSRY